MEETLLFEALRVTAGGFNHDQMTLAWTENGAVRSLVLSDDRAKETFLSLAPPSLAPQLMQWRKQTERVQRGMRFGWMLLGFILLLPLLLGLALWWQSDTLAAWAVQRISLASERQWGDLIYAQTQTGLTLLPKGETTQAIEEIGERLTKGAPYPFHWHVANDPTVNAFAIPGGHVVIFTGLIRAADSAEEVAGVLAHEAEHVLQRHSLKGIVHQLGWQVVLTLIFSEWGGQGSGQIGEAAAQLPLLRFGRDQESEADREALALLKEAKVDPNGMITFFHRLAKEEGVSIPLLSTHPPSASRAEAIQNEIKKLGPWESKPLPYDWAQIKKKRTK